MKHTWRVKEIPLASLFVLVLLFASKTVDAGGRSKIFLPFFLSFI